jgi:hypothetical protein
MIRAHQPGSEPIDIPETIPNPVVVPKPTPTPTEPAPKEPVRFPEKVPSSGVSTGRREVLSKRSRGVEPASAVHVGEGLPQFPSQIKAPLRRFSCHSLS